MKLCERYRLIEPLGAGTTGRVWLAETPIGEQVVLKVGHERALAGALATEALHAALVSSDRLPRFRGLGFLRLDEAKGLAVRAEAGLPCLVLDVVPGGPLDLATGTVELAHRVALGVAEALAELHAAGLAHGDVKPANILIAENQVSLVDLGAVCDADDTSVRAATPRYLGRGDRDLGDARGRDQLALGLVLAELLDSKVRRAADPLTRARQRKPTNRVGEVALALIASAPGARPSIRWALGALSHPAPWSPLAEEPPARRRQLIRASYLRLRRGELGASTSSVESAPWLAEALSVATLARAMCHSANVPLPAVLAHGEHDELAPLNPERRLRWIVSFVGATASSWGDAFASATERELAYAFERLLLEHSPRLWTLIDVTAALRGMTRVPAPRYPVAPVTIERVTELARALARAPADVEAIDCVERQADELPETLVLDAADALRLSGELSRAEALLTGRPKGDVIRAEMFRRSGELVAARTCALMVVNQCDDASGRAHSVLARLALDEGQLDEASGWLENKGTAPEYEVAALVAHRAGDWALAAQLARKGLSLASCDEQRARLSATRAYVLHPSTPETVRELFSRAAEHALGAGAILEEATYRTGEAAACVELGAFAAAESAARRAILLFEDVLAQPRQSTRAWLARAALWAGIDAEHEAIDAANSAIRYSEKDLRAAAYARWAACDALPIGAPKARPFVEAETARLANASRIDDDRLHASARIWRHAPELISKRDALDSQAGACSADAQLEWWRARSERLLLAPNLDRDDARHVLVALADLVDTVVANSGVGKAMYAGRRLATALGDTRNSARFEAARDRIASRTLEGCGDDLARAARSASWLTDRGAAELAPTTPSQTIDLQQLVRALGERDDLDVLLNRVLDLLLLWTGAERGLLLLSTRSGDLVPRATRHLSHRELHAEQLAVSMSLARRALTQGSPVIAIDAMSELSDSHASVQALELRSVLVLPLVARGDVIGVVYLDDRFRKGAFGERELAWATTVAPIAAVSIADARRQAALTRALRRSERAFVLAERTIARRESALAVAQAELAHNAEGRQTRHRYEAFIGESEPLHRLLALLDRVAVSDVPVLIQGESGTGKELVARAIHNHGARAEHPFVGENCGAVPESLLESTLFGHVRGSFTGAHRTQVGLFEAAHNGTLFLDEIGEMSLAMQTKLLRVLEDGVVRPIGSESSRRVAVRVVAATHRDLRAMVKSGTFREDLLYRLDVIQVRVPALRERARDIPLLVQHFLVKHAPGRRVQMNPQAQSALLCHPWPGNIRQLENEVRRALVLCDDVIELQHLTLRPETPTTPAELGLQLRPRVNELEAELIRAALLETAGNQTQAAKRLGLSRFGLHKLIKRLGLSS